MQTRAHSGPGRPLMSLLAFIAMVLLSGTSALQSSLAQGVEGELLVAIPSEDCLRAKGIVIDPLRFYHRLPSHVLAGITQRALSQLLNAGITPLILDTRTPDGRYAVVTGHPGMEQVEALRTPGCRSLFSQGDLVLVRGGDAALSELRRRGFSVHEIGYAEIPPAVLTTHLPGMHSQQKSDLIEAIISQVSDSMVTAFIQGLQDFGTRYWANVNRDSVARWVRSRYIEAGLTDVSPDSFLFSSQWQQNVVATIPGTVNPDAEIIVGGHHDSYSYNVSLAPGADDNASGTAAALEMARVLKLVDYQPRVTLRFMGFAAEEAGLRGSASYAQRARSLNRDIRAMMNYDMIGSRNQAQADRDVLVVWYTGAEAFADLHAATAQLYTTLSPVMTTAHRGSSDSYSFWQQGYNSVFCIERDFSPYYHSPSDLLQYLDIPYASEIIKAGLAMLLTLDQMPPPVAGLRVFDCGDGSSLLAAWDSVEVPDVAVCRISVGRTSGVYDTTYMQKGGTQLITGLNAGERYYIGVSVMDMIGQEGIVTEQTAVPRSVPLSPAGLWAVDTSAGVRLQWRSNHEMDLHGYNVYRAANTPAAFARLNTEPVTDTVWIDAGVGSGQWYYNVTAVDSTGNESHPSDTVAIGLVVSVGDVAEGMPIDFRLFQNYPNPFNAITQIPYDVGSPGPVELTIHDILGRKVATLVKEQKIAGRYVAVWNATAVASGVYVCTFRGRGFIQSRSVVLLK
ncbi:MAG: M20/M25/M40 family metallo-hydrolase [Ignavibacteria bacterium]|nr:M20/M25/M40 family metallo-hydrolase [Ignavibacteria bacterium]